MRFSSRLDWRLDANSLARLADAKRSAGVPLLDLTETNPTRAGLPYASKEILAALADERSLAYEPAPRGLATARAAIAEAYGYDAGRVVLASSTSEAYAWLFKLLCDPGDEVLVPRPSYPLFDYLAAFESVRIRQYPLRYHEGWWIDFEALEQALTGRTRTIVVVNPNNPTGSFLKRAEWERLAAVCAARACPVLSDEVFAEFPLTAGADRVATLAGQEETPAFVLGGLSKSCGLPQMKLGWVVVAGPPDWRTRAIERLELIADTYLPVSAPVQHAVPRWLAARRAFQSAVRERLRANLDSTPSALRVEGGWSAILRLPRTRSEEEWVVGLLEECDVLVQPGYFYDFETEAYAVVSLLTPPEVYREGIARLESYAGA